MAAERPEDPGWPAVPPEEASWMIRLFSSSRYFAAFAVLGSFLAAVTLYVYGTLVVIKSIWESITEPDVSVEGAKHLQVIFIERPMFSSLAPSSSLWPSGCTSCLSSPIYRCPRG